jgi:hypothetical protein
VRKQATNGACGEKALGDPAKNPLAEPAVSISACHNQVSVYLLRYADQLACDRSDGILGLPHGDCYVVAREVAGDIVDMRLLRLFVPNINDFNHCHRQPVTRSTTGQAIIKESTANPAFLAMLRVMSSSAIMLLPARLAASGWSAEF